jgi:alginate O-acetyltransferase complex protein AlgI
MSIGIYTWFVGSYIWILLLLAVLVIITSGSTSKWVLFIPILSLIAGFVALKYNTTSPNTLSLPIGYSVFAFTCISYIVDTAHNNTKEKKIPIDVFCYLFFFPKMLAGPIIRFADMQNQLNTCKVPTRKELYTAFKIIVYASFCKYVLADNLNIVTDYENYGPNAWLSTFLFAFQLYLDFFAYSNYAIAFALLVGINLPESFNSPYRAATFRAFWKRWNITVSSWLKDYVYIPLGGNKKGNKWRIYANIILTFIVSGLWHGATFPFLLWGVLHGFLVIMERILFRESVIANQVLRNIYRWFVFVIASLLWQLFRIEGMDSFFEWIGRLFTLNPINYSILAITIVTFLTVYLLDCKIVKHLIFSTSDNKIFVYREVAFVCALFFLVILFHSQPQINFFYFKF